MEKYQMKYMFDWAASTCLWGMNDAAVNRFGCTVDISKSTGEGRVMQGVITNPNDPTSAANVGYVNAVGQGIIDGVNREFHDMDKKINKVGAGAAAMASLPMPPFDGDEKWGFSAAVGNYRNATAGAIGAFYRPQDNVIMNVRGSFGNDENMVGGGVSVALNRGNTPGVSKSQMVKTINAQALEISNQANEIAALKETVRQLAQQVNSK